MTKGMAIFTTSSGSRTIKSPFSENITKMVKSEATRVRGLMRGMKRVRYHSSHLSRIRKNRVRNPATNGGADLNAYVKVEDQAGCCSPAMDMTSPLQIVEAPLLHSSPG